MKFKIPSAVETINTEWQYNTVKFYNFYALVVIFVTKPKYIFPEA